MPSSVVGHRTAVGHPHWSAVGVTIRARAEVIWATASIPALPCCHRVASLAIIGRGVPCVSRCRSHAGGVHGHVGALTKRRCRRRTGRLPHLPTAPGASTGPSWPTDAIRLRHLGLDKVARKEPDDRDRHSRRWLRGEGVSRGYRATGRRQPALVRDAASIPPNDRRCYRG